MREILFRGKTDSGKWVEGDILNYLGSGKVHIAQNYKGAGGREVIPETVGQYTGVLDKNGIRIFEGDIVKHYCKAGLGDTEYFDRGIVYWSDELCKVMRTCEDDNPCDVRTYCVYEVIGNIHDNPELAEELK